MLDNCQSFVDQRVCESVQACTPSLKTSVSELIKGRTDAVIHGLFDVLEHHRTNSAVIECLGSQVHDYLDTSNDEMVWLKRCKYLLTYPLSKYLKNELPKKPDIVFEPRGTLNRWMRARLNAFNRKNTHLWYSWLQCKRSALPASDNIIQSTYNDHLISLTREDPGQIEIVDKIFEDKTFQKTLVRVKNFITHNYKENFEDSNPSNNASFTKNRSEGGQLAALRELTNSRHNPEECCLSPYLQKMIYVSVWTYEGKERKVISIYRRYNEDWKDLRETVRNFFSYRSYLNGNDNWHLNCTIQGIVEPLKVRVISKGESLPYYAMNKLQKCIHSSMRHMNCFRLIGRPFFTTDILDICKKSEKSDKWFSIDYSAATDNLSWIYSSTILKFIIGGIPEFDQELALKVLGPHNLYYPVQNKKGEIEFKGTMQSGQLMGSILSFPILCLANLGVYLYVNRGSQCQWSHEERLDHVLINGDDMLYSADSSLWDDHIKIGKAVGLEMSVGKAYCHDTYCNINSTSCHMKLNSQRTEIPYEIRFLNTGLLHGQHKVLETIENSPNEIEEGPEFSDEIPTTNFVVNINEILEGSLPGRQRDLLKKILKEHATEIHNETQLYLRGGDQMTRNLFLPLSLGGMGVEVPVGWRFLIKPIQRKLAYTLYYKYRKIPRSFGLPLPGVAVEKIQVAPVEIWDDKKDIDDQILKINLKDSNMRINRSIHLNEMILYDSTSSYML
jgi:hypothetical protein